MSGQRLYLIRHGHTTWNGPPTRMQGNRGDSHLSERGRAEAAALGPQLPPFERIVSSPLTRCLQTVDCLFARTPDALDQRLAEIDVGSFTGRWVKEIRENDPEGLRGWRETPAEVRVGGDGETLAELRDRFVAGVMDVFAGLNGRERVLVATHGGCLRTLVCHVEGRPLSTYHDMSLPNLTLFELSGGDGPTGHAIRVVTAAEVR